MVLIKFSLYASKCIYSDSSGQDISIKIQGNLIFAVSTLIFRHVHSSLKPFTSVRGVLLVMDMTYSYTLEGQACVRRLVTGGYFGFGTFSRCGICYVTQVEQYSEQSLFFFFIFVTIYTQNTIMPKTNSSDSKTV